jgi:hypothetical protein
MIVQDFHIVCVTSLPAKAEAPLIIDSNRMPASEITLQQFQPIGRRYPEVGKVCRCIKLRELSLSPRCEIGGKTLDWKSGPQSRNSFVVYRTNQAFVSPKNTKSNCLNETKPYGIHPMFVTGNRTRLAR